MLVASLPTPAIGSPTTPGGVRGTLTRFVLVLAMLTILACLLGECGVAMALPTPPSAPAAAVSQGSAAAATSIKGRLGGLAEYTQQWAQTPTGATPDLSDARATVAGLLSQARIAGDSTELHALAPGLSYLGWLLALHPTSLTQKATLAQEANWSATELTNEATRGNGPLGSAATSVEQIREASFRARWELTLGNRRAAALAATEAQQSFVRVLAPTLGPTSPAGRALAQATSAARSGDEQALAHDRGSAIAAITTAAYQLTLRALGEGHPALAREWAAVRDLGPSAGQSTVQDNAMQAAKELAAQKLTPAGAALAVRRDELDFFQRRTLALVQQATLAGYLGLGPAQLEAAAMASGYWQVLAPIYAQSLDPAQAGQATAAFAALLSTTPGASPVAGPSPGTSAAATARFGLQSADNTALAALGAFVAAPPTAAEQRQRVQQLVEAMRFTIARQCGRTQALPLNGEPQGTVSGAPVVTRLINELRPSLNAANAARLTQAAGVLTRLPGAYGISGEESSPKTYRESSGVQAACNRATADISAVFPAAWSRHGDNADFERIDQILHRAQLAAEHGEWSAAGAAAREAYAIFDLTPEQRLLAVDPGLAYHIESLFWNGGTGDPSLFEVLSDHPSPTALRRPQAALEGGLDQAEVVLEASHSATAVAVNSGIVVFREGLEALLIVAALSAGFVTAGSHWRRPAITGAIAAVPATLLTWALSNAILKSLAGYSLQLQAVLDVAALAVLLIMLAWFFQKFCWTRFVAREQARHRKVMVRTKLAGIVAPSVGLFILGFTVIYREGFETVLYLQALREQAGGSAVIEGVLVGTAFTAVIALLMLRLRRRLPYRGVVVATATLIGILTVVMVGQAMRALQAVGWLAITPVHFELPVWAGQWLGLYPSTQTLFAQLACAIAILLAAVLSEWLRTRRLERRVAAARERAAAKRAANAAARRSAKGDQAKQKTGAAV